MAKLKKKEGNTPNSGPVAWLNDPKYPEKRGVCDVCGQRDDLKLSYDCFKYICKNDHACLLRWQKKVAKQQ